MRDFYPAGRTALAAASVQIKYSPACDNKIRSNKDSRTATIHWLRNSSTIVPITYSLLVNFANCRYNLAHIEIGSEKSGKRDFQGIENLYLIIQGDQA